MKGCGCCENVPCGCCEGVEPLTPQATANRPGLNALYYRVGTHSTFFETMQARLSNFYLETSHFDKEGEKEKTKTYPLKDLRTRSRDDMSIALLDAAATMLDVLTFYQERIANEGYLQTATERRSILEMARLVGYTLRPGVAASVYLAYTMDDNSEPAEIPIGAHAQSVPAQDELPQSFETSEKLEARREWNDLTPRATRPQKITAENAEVADTIYLEGTETNLKPNDPLLFVFDGRRVLRKVRTVEPLFSDKKTKITLQVSFKNAIQQVIERHLVNFGEFCVDAQDELIVRVLKLYSNSKGTPDSDIPKSVIDQLKKDAMDLIIDIDKSENTRVQKWFGSLLDELLRTSRALGALDAFLDILRLMTSFQQFTKTINLPESLPEAIKILRARDGFNDFLKEAVKIIRAMEGFNEEALTKLIGNTDEKTNTSAFNSLLNLTKPLSLPASKQPANSLHLGRDAKKIYSADQDTLPQILIAFNKEIGTTAYAAWANVTVTKSSPVKVYALRVTASLFGSSAPKRIEINAAKEGKNGESEISTKVSEQLIVEVFGSPTLNKGTVKHEEENIIYLDSIYDKILPDTWVVVDMSKIKVFDIVGGQQKKLLQNFELSAVPDGLLITRTKDVSPSISRADYGMSGKATRLELKNSWFNYILTDGKMKESEEPEFQLVRKTVVHAQSEQLELADEPINDNVCGGKIELGWLYNGLRAGRWIIVSGERTDIPDTSGVRASELVMLAGIEQSFDASLPGDKVHSTLILANSLAYTYKRDTVRVYGNVVKATHGETRVEVLGSGDATQALQAFQLKQPPLTYVSAPTASGIKSTLQVRVNDIEWDETDTLAELKPQDRNFITKTDDEAKTTVIFGNGEQGARPPTGIENITAVYRNGIGKGGNVKPEQISLVVTKPLGVKEVINPLRASGGADKETRDQVRRNAPIALMALDRLVSTRDYADYARTFAGIGKAYSTRLSDGRREVVHLTIAGAEDVPIDINSDLYNNLRRSLSKYGDPFQPVQVVPRELLALVIIARVQINSKYLWESVEPKIRAALLDSFSFERRELGQNVYLSEVISAIQRVEGVAYADVDVLDSISETQSKDEEFWEKKRDRWSNSGIADAPEASDDDEPENAHLLDRCNPKQYISAKLASVREDDDGNKIILPARLAYLLPDVPDTLILNRIDEEKK